MFDTAFINKVIEYRRILHTIPEIGFDLFKTSKFIKNELESMSFKTEEVAKTGIVAFIKGELNETIAFRSDMDALNVEEENDIPFISQHKGKMHACGHDGHMAILLGFARFISDKNLKKNILLIFQPAEEGPGGAKVIVEEKVLERYNVKYIFGIHLYPELNEGIIGIKEGEMLAQNGELDIEVIGKGSHGAQPQSGIDALLVASFLIQSYQSIISRSINPLNSSVITIGTITGGEARNIIASSIKMSGTIRCFNQEEYNNIKNRILEINKGILIMHNATIKCNITDFYPPVINDPFLYNIVKKNIENYEIIKPMMISEDFAFYQQEVPGLFMMLGTKNESLGFIHPLHSCFFNFKDEVLIKGIKTYLDICKALKVS